MSVEVVKIEKSAARNLKPEAADREMLAAILHAAKDPAIDHVKTSALIDLMERMEDRNAQKAFWLAMKAAQDEIKPIARDAEVKGTGGSVVSRYATLESIDDAIRPVYLRHGFCLSFNSRWSDNTNQLVVVCRCAHDAGHVETYELGGALDTVGDKGTTNKTPIKGLGSSNTFLKRYLTCNIFNVQMKGVDNDGGGAYDEPISQDKADTLYSMLDEAGMTTPETRARFYKLMGVKRCEDIQERFFEIAFTTLRSAIKRATATEKAN